MIKKMENHNHNKEKIYTCPMHPEVRRSQPGICPKCGMNLVPEESKKEDYNKHAGHKAENFLKKFIVSLILTIPILIYSDIFQKVFKFEAPSFPGQDIFILILATLIFFYGGWVFIVGAARELRARLPGMMTLIALAISAAYAYSVFVVVVGKIYPNFIKGDNLFWELATLITVMLLGHWIEMKAVSGAQSALKELSKLLPDTAEIIFGAETKIISLSDIKVGDVAILRPGGKVPADGIVIDGKSDVDESLATGESKPVSKDIGSEVIAGTINGDGVLKIKIEKIGENTFLAGVMRLVAQAQSSKSRLQILSDRAAFYLTIIAVIGGMTTFIYWIFFGGNVFFATERLVAVLVIACPHALGLAVPLVASISTQLAAFRGFLVRDRLALEMARKIEVVLFDKTGTLTQGKYGVTHILVSDAAKSTGINEDKILQLAASIDANSEHFVAKAIVAEAKTRSISLLEVKRFQRLPGKGVSGEILFSGIGDVVYVGGQSILSEGKFMLSEKLKSDIEKFSQEGKTVIYVVLKNEILGVIALADLIREESKEAISALKKMGVKTVMITGDSAGVAKWVADEVGIDEYFSKVLPQEKSEKVKILQERGLRVAMVGDGINDAPALTQADIGIAIGVGTNVAIESAGIILVRNDPRDIVKIINLSKATYRKMVQNLFWATGYNIVALPLAAGVLVSQGVMLQPALAALFMSASTVIVAINALFLKRVKFGY